MPNYYAHFQFGNQVLKQLPQTLQQRLEAEREAYRVGQYGPDPLFFYHPLTRNHARMTGVELHHRPARAVMERLRAAVEENKPYASGYAAGFLCHFALDSQCHAYINDVVTRENVTHAGLESEFDRLLMERSGLDPRRDTPLPPLDMPDAFYDTILTYAYPGVTAAQFQKGFRLFRRVSRIYTCLVGNPARHVVNCAASTIPGCSFFRHAILPKRTKPAYQECCARMAQLFQEAVAPTAAQLTAFFEGISRREPLGAWFDRDFNGRVSDVCTQIVGHAS